MVRALGRSALVTAAYAPTIHEGHEDHKTNKRSHITRHVVISYLIPIERFQQPSHPFDKHWQGSYHAFIGPTEPAGVSRWLGIMNPCKAASVP